MRRFSIPLLLLALLAPLSTYAQSNAVDISGLWLVEVPRYTCIDGRKSFPAKRSLVRIEQSGPQKTFEAHQTYTSFDISGRSISAQDAPFVTQSTLDYDVPQSVINEINRKNVRYRFNGEVSDNGSIITGTDHAYCFEWRTESFFGIETGSRLVRGPEPTAVRVILRRVDVRAHFVRRHGSALVPARTLTAGDTVQLAVTSSLPLPEPPTVENFSWRSVERSYTLPEVDLEQETENPNTFLSRPIKVVSANILDSRSGAITGDPLRIWGATGSQLEASVALVGTTQSTLVFSILEGIMEASTALLLFALLAFVVERLSNAITVLLDYLPWWRQRFSPSKDLSENDRDACLRNRKVAVFVLGVVIAIPLCLIFGFNIVDQLQLPDMGATAEQAATGLLAATGAEPIREIIHRTEAGEGRFAFGSSGGQKVIQVDARIVAPPGSTIRIMEDPGLEAERSNSGERKS